MSALAPRFSTYNCGGGREWLVSHGPEDGAHVLIVPPLFEELNRTRQLLAQMMRRLAAAGIATHLPDLPGTAESSRTLEDTSWSEWREAIALAVQAVSASYIVSIRGGSLLDDSAADADVLRFAPTEGKRLLRDMVRARSVTDKAFDSTAQKAIFDGGPTLLGGYPVSAAFASALRQAEPADSAKVQTIRLEGDPGPAYRHIAGPPLWRRAEPAGSPELASALAQEIVNWIG